MEDYSYPVHRSLFKRKMIMGVPTVPFVIIALFTIIILMDFKAIAVIPISKQFLCKIKFSAVYTHQNSD